MNFGTSFWLELLPLARARALLADGAPDALVEALEIVATCLRSATEAHNIRQVIGILAFQSLVLQGLRRAGGAAEALTRALSLAEPAGFVRTFLDLGEPLADLLRSLKPPRVLSGYRQKLLNAFGWETRAARLRAQAQDTSVSPLTARELELLALLQQRLSIQEIAERLVISASTVKTHTGHIYEKLGARNRREAIAKASALGILLPE